MNLQVLTIGLVAFFLNLKLTRLEEVNDQVKTDAENGLRSVVEAVNVLIYGEPKEVSYKDLFIDTSKSLFSSMDGGVDMLTVDDMLRVLFQSVIILSTGRRPDLIPRDFTSRHAIYATFVNELNKILQLLSTKGTDKVSLKDLRVLLKTLKSDEFWASITKLKEEVSAEILLEEQREKELSKQEL